MTTERVQVTPRIGEFAHPKEAHEQPAPSMFSAPPQPSLEKSVAMQAGRFMSASSEYWLIGIIIVLITVILMLIVYIVRFKNGNKESPQAQDRGDVRVQEVEDLEEQVEPQEKNITPTPKQALNASQQRELLSKPLQLRGSAHAAAQAAPAAQAALAAPQQSKPLLVVSGDADVPSQEEGTEETPSADAASTRESAAPEEHAQQPEERRESDFTPPPAATPSRRGGRRGRPSQQ